MRPVTPRVDGSPRGVSTAQLQPHWLIPDWLGFVGEAPTEEVKVPPPSHKRFLYLYNPDDLETKTVILWFDTAALSTPTLLGGRCLAEIWD